MWPCTQKKWRHSGLAAQQICGSQSASCFTDTVSFWPRSWCSITTQTDRRPCSHFKSWHKIFNQHPQCYKEELTTRSVDCAQTLHCSFSWQILSAVKQGGLHALQTSAYIALSALFNLNLWWIACHTMLQVPMVAYHAVLSTNLQFGTLQHYWSWPSRLQPKTLNLRLWKLSAHTHKKATQMTAGQTTGNIWAPKYCIFPINNLPHRPPSKKSEKSQKNSKQRPSKGMYPGWI